ncbi:hypothetical protein [Pseudoalteromonas piscicida]|uniref:hypothetical protein n=1 Tax=Pseudoalteromonas piscicida TaxID=43662 RepID=UPI0030B32A97
MNLAVKQLVYVGLVALGFVLGVVADCNHLLEKNEGLVGRNGGPNGCPPMPPIYPETKSLWEITRFSFCEEGEANNG